MSAYWSSLRLPGLLSGIVIDNTVNRPPGEELPIVVVHAPSCAASAQTPSKRPSLLTIGVEVETGPGIYSDPVN